MHYFTGISCFVQVIQQKDFEVLKMLLKDSIDEMCIHRCGLWHV